MAVEELDKVRVSANFELGDGSLYQNIYYFMRTGVDTITNATLTTTIKARIEAMYATIAGQTKSDTVEQLSFVDKIEWSGTQWLVTENVGTFTPVFTPTQVGDALPYNCAPFIVFKTSRPKTVGRKFLFPFDEAWQANSILVGGALTAMAAFGALAITSLPLGGANAMTPGVVRTGTAEFFAFQVAVVNDVIGTQRKRRPGVGA